MNAPFHDDAMLDDAMLVDALDAIEYMNGISKEAPIGDNGSASNGDEQNLIKQDPSSSAGSATTPQPTEMVLPTNVERTLEESNVASVDASDASPSASLVPVPGNPIDVAPGTAEFTPSPMTQDNSSSPPSDLKSKPTTSSPYVKVIVTKESGLLGFGVLPVKGVCGIQVSTLQPDSSAAKAGLRVGDVLLRLDDTDVSSMHMSSIIQILQAVLPGKPLHISIFRPSVAVPTTSPIYHSTLQPPSSLMQRAVFRDPSSAAAPSAKKAKTTPPSSKSWSTMTSTASLQAESAALKKQLDVLTKELQAATADKAKLGEKNAMLRKRVQHLVISADEGKVQFKAECDRRIAALVQDNTQLQTALATAKAQARLDSRAVFDTDVTMDMKTQLEALTRQVGQFEELDKKRKETRKAHAQVEFKLADKYKANLHQLLVETITTELKTMSQMRAQSSLRTNAFGIAGTATVIPSHVKIQLELVRRVAVHRLFNVHMAADSLGFPLLSAVHVTLTDSSMSEVFGKQLMYEERPGLHLVAVAPMELQYDPTTEDLLVVCKWTEQNVIRELARNIRM
ncbi:hypothetical protein H257_07466 [Aphanomyces astaci]|uniref:PDZ domain-containing protein n=1 Tax=Aphanomyces astaci TaxID=112090 RepID=W4GIC2_APHAT|nr:hypothetical protein H257_07466 [Aphanomyces astaci]ETV79465.1 hypothetical protein H257_07466 [Aphanomyces astaci]|eukprot:XP_009831306.1 hypothetical protein H257_07466 [Aphanomyces astaci]